MAIKIYNTLTRQKEIFKPILGNRVGFYVCGPTVYGPGHLGHARTYISFDIIRRWLEQANYKITYIINITDIHDDIKPETDTKKFAREFLADLKSLNIKPANKYPRVSQHLKEIKELIAILLKKGFAYKVKDNIYFKVSKFKDYGKLSGRRLEKNLKNTRIQSDKYERDEVADFALWKGSRPGWHIECSAMSKKYLGEQFDIHAGALDLIFPHHENEIAQSEAAYGKKPFVKYWMHSGLLEVNGKKMSKSLNNYIGIPDIKDKRVFRFLALQHHYRSPLNYTKKSLEQAQAALNKLDRFKDGNVDISKEMNDDFNTPKALAKIFKARLWPPEMEKIFGITRKKIKISKKTKILIKERKKARKNKDFKKADELRKKLEKLGYKIQDKKL